jgi:hypothetical protein
MRPLAWSAIATGAAAVLFVTLSQGANDLRVAGAVAGALVAIAGVILGVLSPGTRSPGPTLAAVTPARRFFRERRAAPRQVAGNRVRVSVDGHAYEATLLNVSSSGALLRLPPHVTRCLRAEVGAPVRIEDHPAGALARVGAHGLYVDFAVAFGPAETAANFDAAPHP